MIFIHCVVVVVDDVIEVVLVWSVKVLLTICLPLTWQIHKIQLLTFIVPLKIKQTVLPRNNVGGGRACTKGHWKAFFHLRCNSVFRYLTVFTRVYWLELYRPSSLLWSSSDFWWFPRLARLLTAVKGLKVAWVVHAVKVYSCSQLSYYWGEEGGPARPAHTLLGFRFASADVNGDVTFTSR